MEFIPYAIIISLNGCIGYTIVKSSKFRHQFELRPLPKASMQENQMELLNENEFCCQSCNLLFRDETTFQIHCYSHRPTVVPEFKSKINLKCPECSKKFENWSDHITHSSIHGEHIQNGQNEETKNQKKIQLEVEMAITLAAISLMFVLCQSIKLIADIYEQTVCDYFKIAIGEEESKSKCYPPTHIDVATSFGNLFVCINSAANFLIYMVKGKKFRDAFYQTYFSCGPNNHSFTITVHSNS